MKTRSKALLLSLCAILLVVASVFGTMAYLTSADVAVNTFTVGDVKITLDEEDVDDDENKSDNVTVGTEIRDKANKYHLLPGQSYTKDPQVAILEGSEESYIRMLVKVGNYSNLKAAFKKENYPTWYNGDDFLLQYLVEGWDDTKWISTKVISVVDDVATYEFRYSQKIAGSEEDNDGVVDETRLEALFNKIVIPGSINNVDLANLKNVTINVEAHAIQAAGFADANAAWSAFDNQ